MPVSSLQRITLRAGSARRLRRGPNREQAGQERSLKAQLCFWDSQMAYSSGAFRIIMVE